MTTVVGHAMVDQSITLIGSRNATILTKTCRTLREGGEEGGNLVVNPTTTANHVHDIPPVQKMAKITTMTITRRGRNGTEAVLAEVAHESDRKNRNIAQRSMARDKKTRTRSVVSLDTGTKERDRKR
jgi:hypothetical protein